MKVKCPICQSPVNWDDNAYRPFCSERCKLIDLGKWASEQYRIPDKNGASAEEEGGDEDEEPKSNGEPRKA